jgi:hypothetical protein
MDERELRNRLKKIDPVSSGVETRSVSDERSQQMLEKIMDQTVKRNPNRMVQYLVGAAAVVALVIGGFAVFGGPADPQAPATAMELSLGDGDAMASCLAPSADVLRDMQIAFRGTATEIEGEYVTLSVDEWYVGGTEGVVRLFAPAGLEALIGVIDFQQGDSYLISAWDGTVNYCGFSGEATPELQAMYDEAFAS